MERRDSIGGTSKRRVLEQAAQLQAAGHTLCKDGRGMGPGRALAWEASGAVEYRCLQCVAIMVCICMHREVLVYLATSHFKVYLHHDEYVFIFMWNGNHCSRLGLRITPLAARNLQPKGHELRDAKMSKRSDERCADLVCVGCRRV